MKTELPDVTKVPLTLEEWAYVSQAIDSLIAKNTRQEKKANEKGQILLAHNAKFLVNIGIKVQAKLLAAKPK